MTNTNRNVFATATIASGASLSGAVNFDSTININNVRLFGVDMPDPWTTANIVVYQKHVDGTYKPVKDEDGNDLTIATIAGGICRFSNPSQYSALTDIKLLSGSVATPVNQGADRIITLVLRAI